MVLTSGRESSEKYTMVGPTGEELGMRRGQAWWRLLLCFLFLARVLWLDQCFLVMVLPDLTRERETAGPFNKVGHNCRSVRG